VSSPTVQIQVRLGSTRLPGKVLYSLKGRRIVRRVVDQVWKANKPERTLLAIGDQPENAAIEGWSMRNNVEYYCGPENNLLNRHLEAAKAVDGDPIIRVTGDCPFLPSSEIDRVIQKHLNNNARYTTNVTEEMPVGTAVDVIDRVLLEELQHLGDTHPVRRLRLNPEKWAVSFTPGEKWTKFSDAHIAVDTPTDYWTLTDAVQSVGNDPVDVLRWVTENGCK
jgi:spore coat polysaccharide biosynthesis protein SpsF